MSVGTLGPIEDFNPAQNDRESNTEGLDQYLVANNVTGQSKNTLSVNGPKACEVLKSLVTPDKPSNKTCGIKSGTVDSFQTKPTGDLGTF